jgi:EAL domain-containing protein (putative c-di-GMP-specific phosphodiesterase class I)/GGDEF domain-containing protein
MSMYRQMWLAIILSTLIAMLGGLLASTLNARSYLTEQLSSKNTDNATALALALSQQNPTAVVIELTVSALFDSGHYELIRVVDPLGKVIVERIAQANAREVPNWFVQALPLAAAPGRAQISSGWNQLGTLTLISNSRFAYEALWKSAVQLVLALGFAGLVGGCLGTMVLRRLREPLQRVIGQATAISERRFVLIEVPSVPELKQLAMAMNSTVTRLKSMFVEEAERLEGLRATGNYDALTGLPNRTFFLIQLLEALDSEEAAGGSFLLVRVADWQGLKQALGPEEADNVLKAFAEVLSQQAQIGHGVAARIGEADFALLLSRQVDGPQAAAQLLQVLVQTISSGSGKAGPVAHLGLEKLQNGQDMAGLMANASRALAAAEARGVSGIAETGTISAGVIDGEAESAQLIRQALAQGRARLALTPVRDLKGALMHHEARLELVLGENQAWQQASRLRQLAEGHEIASSLDTAALQLGLEHLKQDPAEGVLAIQLSSATLRDQSSRASLLGMIRGRQLSAGRLWLEATEADVLRHMSDFAAFMVEARKAGAKVGLIHFGRHFNQAGLVHDLGLDFLKVDASLVRGLHFNADNQIFLKDLASVAKKMGMQVYAEGVVDREELAALSTTGFDGAAGSVFRDHPPRR